MNKKKTVHKNTWIYLIEVLIGVVVMGCVFLIAVNIDMAETEAHLSSTIGYIKEQYTQHKRLNLASETKSIMRMIESAHQIQRQVDDYYSQTSKHELTEDVIAEFAEENYVSGVLILDSAGKVTLQYYRDDNGVSEATGYLDSGSLMQVIEVPEKSYAVRLSCPDGAYVDLAAIGMTDRTGIIVVYYYSPADYVNAFSNSVESLLSGYSLERDGTIVVSSGKQIVASNNAELIGKSTDDITILRKIREAATSDKLVHAKSDDSSLSRNFGLMEHGRDYYVYAYMPESDVFNTTFQNMLYSLIIYIIILIVVNMGRWRTAHDYREEQMQIQEEYTERLKNKNDQLKEALDQADRANAAKTSFLARMSHDIRTPLNGIIGLLAIDENHPDDIDLIRENQKKMKISANHLLSLINDVLQMSKLESDEIPFVYEPINLDELSRDVLTIVEQRAADAGITLEYDKTVDRIELKNVYGSPLHLRQIFLNIYGNCIKYNKVGGKVETKCTCLGVKDDIVTYQWIIQDTGIGMSKEFLQHIFEPFAQERSDARSVYNGTGLGMSIVKQLIDRMNGTITVTSEPGVGSTFVITLPFEITEEQTQQQEEKTTTVSSELGNLHLLLVEDNELNAEIAKTLLSDQGYTITMAYDGKQAVEAFEQNPPDTFDAILMDVMMPVVDGLTATRMIRDMDRPDAKEIPIIAMTANAFDADVKRCLDAGMNGHLAKPLQMDRIIAMLGKFCRKKG